MRVFERTFTSIRANLDFDDRLLDDADRRREGSIRFWEARAHAVVLGRSCGESGLALPAERRSSGGGTVLVGPGCLCYTIALPLERYPGLRDVRESYCAILGSIARALGSSGVAIEGPSDLTWNGRKFSGNAQRRTRDAVLHHGTILYAFDLDLVSRVLPEPRRQPDYRHQRTHSQFLTNLPMDGRKITEAIADAKWRDAILRA